MSKHNFPYEFHDVDENLSKELMESLKVYMLGDYNAHPGESFWHELSVFCSEQNWVCADTEIMGAESGCCTYIIEAHGYERWLDHCIVTQAAYRVQEGFVQVGPKKYFFPSRYKREAELFYSLPLKADDIWVVSFPRSGKPGGWKDKFDDDLKKEAQEWMEANLKGTDIRFSEKSDS
ncbi:uncharacterized protein LOC113225717 [Hyposmocoma kahamanoa]|uniref:uncharacterized protein LOC113225717 n=1 Tax=Hyposmocoma kahamanoa TaxID=1477025 RepID=UPI000E6DA067|nr:uncharacterized protein LOC113225717 [Hyposmocoma kahamanoa]